MIRTGRAFLLLTLTAIALTACDQNGRASQQAKAVPKPAAQPPNGWRTYGDTRLGFSIAYPEGWSVDKGHAYPNQVHDERLAGVAFIVPQSLSAKTNLSSDSYIAVESAEGASTCDATAFLDQPETQRNEIQGTLHWAVGEMGDAGAGNFYDETVYALVGSKPCLAIRYFIHSTNVANYPEGTVREFDRAALTAMFDRIRSTFSLAQHTTP
jgi:hypothetical protein